MAKSTDSITNQLNDVLVATYALAVKTHAAHWNVTGPQFFSLHEAFSGQYEALFEAADEIAERLRALGEKAPSGIKALAKATELSDLGDHDGQAVVKVLHNDHAALSKRIKKAIVVAQTGGDEATADLLIGRSEAHDKIAWMLAAWLG